MTRVPTLHVEFLVRKALFMLGITIGSRSKGWLLLSSGLGLSTLLLASVTYAAIPAPDGIISGCVSTQEMKGQHLLTLLDTTQAMACGRGQTLITWNQTGPQGVPGVKGDTGPQGPPGPGAVAGIVLPDGTKSEGDGFSVTRNSPGNYTVAWPVGTFSNFSVPLVTSVQNHIAPDIQSYAIGSSAGTFTVDFGGIDTSFTFAVIQVRP
jgi:hypothetical protein